MCVWSECVNVYAHPPLLHRLQTRCRSRSPPGLSLHPPGFPGGAPASSPAPPSPASPSPASSSPASPPCPPSPLMHSHEQAHRPPRVAGDVGLVPCVAAHESGILRIPSHGCLVSALSL